MFINVLAEDIEKCATFADDVLSTNLQCYNSRGQLDKEKIKGDIMVGKIAEVAANTYLSSKGVVTNGVDFNILTKDKKSYAADITGEKDNRYYEFHVKSIRSSSAARFGKSWSFQRHEPLLFNPKSNDVIVLAIVHEDNKVELVKCLRATEVEGDFKDPILERLRATKTVLYYEDIKDKGKECK